MGTKNAPGEFDCYHAAEPDEPMFTLLGRDPAASLTVWMWRALYAGAHGEEKRDKLTEAKRCADAMFEWCSAQGRQVTLTVQIRMLRNAVQCVTGWVASLEGLNAREGVIAGCAVDGLSDAQQRLEYLERLVGDRLEPEKA